jgi:hypothetical protein
MKKCQMTIDDKKSPFWSQTKSCDAKAKWIDKEGRFLCTRHRNSTDRFYVRNKESYRCKPIED